MYQEAVRVERAAILSCNEPAPHNCTCLQPHFKRAQPICVVATLHIEWLAMSCGGQVERLVLAICVSSKMIASPAHSVVSVTARCLPALAMADCRRRRRRHTGLA